MYLKRLEIYGFKSFGTKSVLDFTLEKKITHISAIVGPNGSGKSNVADAVRWVLGEQSSKNLRSKKGEDVIFCGSHTRPRGSFAEVSILLADDALFTVELNSKKFTMNEITISRKLYRSGESEYLINGKKVRLTDIQQLLATFGFGQSSYTVIGQGMVDRLLFFNPTERKVLFDEAAGVKQYEIKREQAVKKLEATDVNLIRIKDILAELEPRVINLRRLVKRAEGRKEIEAELADIQHKYYTFVDFELRSKIDSLSEDKADLNKKIVQIKETIEKLESNIESSQKDSRVEGEQREIEAKLELATSERDKLLQQVAYLEGKLNQGEQKKEETHMERERLSKEKSSLEEKLEFLANKIIEEKTELEVFSKQKNELEDELLIAEKKRQSLTDAASNLEKVKDGQKIEKLRSELNSLIRRKREVDDEIYQLKKIISDAVKNKEEVENYKDELEGLKHAVLDNSTNLEMKEKDLSKITKEIEGIESKLSEYLTEFDQDEIGALATEIQQLINEQREIEQKIYTKEAKSGIRSFFSRLSLVFNKANKLVKTINKKERSTFENDLRNLRQRQQVVESELNKLIIEKERISSRSDFINQKLEHLGTNLKASDNKSLSKLETESGQLDGQIEKISMEIDEGVKGASEQKRLAYLQIDETRKVETEYRNKIYEIGLSIGKRKNTIENQEREVVYSAERIEKVSARIAELDDFTVSSDPEAMKELEEKRVNLQHKDADLAEMRNHLSQILSKQREQNQEIIQLEGERRIAENHLMSIQNELNQLSLEEAKFTTRYEDLVEELRLGEISLKKSDNVSILSQNDKDLLRAKMENLKRRLESIGGVDPETETEYKELNERSQALADQVIDLEKASEDMEKIIKELDQKIKKQFGEVFAHIADEFNRYFQMLFNGGKASLNLGEDEDGNYGIEIKATPPGKRVQSLNVLSGGERTLTSLALVFAILSINPSPFCLLDEVDAALDESNTIKFTKILQDLAKKTQFIVISHNRDTMRVAESLYGITMDNDHVSKLISIRLAEALEKVS